MPLIDVFSLTIDLEWFKELKRGRKVLIPLILTMFLLLREANQIADSLAKFGLSLTCRFFNYVPAFSSNSLIGDAHHVTLLPERILI